jgi:hypothetical protein
MEPAGKDIYHWRSVPCEYLNILSFVSIVSVYERFLGSYKSPSDPSALFAVGSISTAVSATRLHISALLATSTFT